MRLIFALSCLVRSAAATAATLLALTVAVPAFAQVDEARARGLANDLRVYVSEATTLVGDLQPEINGGKLPAERATPEALFAAFAGRYARAAGRPFDDKADGIEGDARRAFAAALREVWTRHQAAMVKGGQDAFVPAYFRAEVLKRFNAQMRGRMQGFATTRSSELINEDSALDHLMKGSPLRPEVTGLMQAGAMEPALRRAGDRVLGYWPMRLAPSCVACHAKSGRKQQEGAFGGALVAEVMIK